MTYILITCTRCFIETSLLGTNNNNQTRILLFSSFKNCTIIFIFFALFEKTRNIKKHKITLDSIYCLQFNPKSNFQIHLFVDRLRKQFRAISTMSLQGMPPLPKSLSGFAEGEVEPEPPTSPGDKPPTDLDSQLIYLKKEMVNVPYVSRRIGHRHIVCD